MVYNSKNTYLEFQKESPWVEQSVCDKKKVDLIESMCNHDDILEVKKKKNKIKIGKFNYVCIKGQFMTFWGLLG